VPKLLVTYGIHCGMVLSLWLPTLMSVRCLVYTFDFSRLLSWWATILCLAILRPLRNSLLHREISAADTSNENLYFW
jgi:hypothetical protein